LTDILIIRADAFVKLGTGHVMRCLALAQAAKKLGKKVIFASAPGMEAIEDRLKDESFEIIHQTHEPGSVEDAQWTSQLAKDKGAEWIVVDGYHFRDDYQKVLKNNGLKVLFIDDYGHCDHYCSDYVLNQNIYASEFIYSSREPHTKLLLGLKYALLRWEFEKYRGFERKIPEVAGKILITLGGSDPDNISTKIIESFESLGELTLEIKLIVGGANPHFEEIKKAVESSSHNIETIRNATNMPELMAWADFAVSGAGSSCWELCLLGLPMAIFILADNQKPIAEGLEEAGASLNMGWGNKLDKKEVAKILSDIITSKNKRTAMSEIDSKLVDGTVKML
jgi:UDP-2,4-diacetamido-2,4,6-trideoxy-beta-L-altropyranose hydrolase